MKMEQTECSKTLAHRIQTPGNYPKEPTQRSEHGKSFKSETGVAYYIVYTVMMTRLRATLPETSSKILLPYFLSKKLVSNKTVTPPVL
jgi:hypothetical protein